MIYDLKILGFMETLKIFLLYIMLDKHIKGVEDWIIFSVSTLSAYSNSTHYIQLQQ